MWLQTQGAGDDWQKVGDDKRGGRRDEKPTNVDPKRITSLLWRERGDRSKGGSGSGIGSSGGGGSDAKGEKSAKPLRCVCVCA